jgi:cell division protein FtsL
VTSPAGGDTRPRAARPAAPRPHFTGRAAILAVVLCAIALSLAYPVREYIAERRQIDQLLAQGHQLSIALRRLKAQQRQLSSPAYIEQQARDRLHMCLPTDMCYEIIGTKTAGTVAARRVAMPWYSKLWSSVQQADQQPGRPPKR